MWISKKEQRRFLLLPLLGGLVFLVLFSTVCLCLVELALGGVGVILTYGLWEQKTWAWTSTFVLQIITVFLAVFWLFPYSSGKEELNSFRYRFFLSIFRIIVSIAALILDFFIAD